MSKTHLLLLALLFLGVVRLTTPVVADQDFDSQSLLGGDEPPSGKEYKPPISVDGYKPPPPKHKPPISVDGYKPPPPKYKPPPPPKHKPPTTQATPRTLP
ncbi:hypothetical protein Ddye_022466 [Dipteronia dyeriana]|uniref:Uncharacterized protein n=1 Tax=Dipteronia dyeriana TaxID=168575 RepID=A0AAD9U489_9ROSI|nr:hypothetical protein Ddye_022466 [Dipteronia dyeriana]